MCINLMLSIISNMDSGHTILMHIKNMSAEIIPPPHHVPSLLHSYLDDQHTLWHMYAILEEVNELFFYNCSREIQKQIFSVVYKQPCSHTALVHHNYQKKDERCGPEWFVLDFRCQNSTWTTTINLECTAVLPTCTPWLLLDMCTSTPCCNVEFAWVYSKITWQEISTQWILVCVCSCVMYLIHIITANVYSIINVLWSGIVGCLLQMGDTHGEGWGREKYASPFSYSRFWMKETDSRSA